ARSAPMPANAFDDPFAAKREAMREEFFGKLFTVGGFIGATDTYKRTMWAAVPDIAVQRAGYTLTMRKGLPEAGAENRLIMAGQELMRASRFPRPHSRCDMGLPRRWFHERSAVKAFPDEAWDAVLQSQSGEDVYLPVDVWGFPGGQSFVPAVPCLFFEGSGGIV